MPSCPSDDTFTDFIEGRLTGEQLNTFYQHASTCPPCTATLAELSRSTASAHPLSRPPADLDAPASSARGLLQEWVVRPEAVGRYRPSEVLGTGGMGIVYLARDTQLNRNVALKVTRVGVSHASARRLLLEAQAMAKLSHRNVVTVHDVGMWREHVFIAMEYLGGGTLARHLLEQRRPWAEVLGKFLQAGEGLAAAHRALIVHRDFKPENVLLSVDGEVRVADFGLARLLSDAGFDTTSGMPAKLETANALRGGLTRLGTMVGTPAYMAPEQIKGMPADHRADIWSFCASIYEALYCELPFPGRTPREVLEHVELGSIRRAPLGTQVPQWLRAVLLRGLEASPAARHQTMDDLLAALRTPRRTRSAWVRPVSVTMAAAGCVAALGVYVRMVGRASDAASDRSRQSLPTTSATLPQLSAAAAGGSTPQGTVAIAAPEPLELPTIEVASPPAGASIVRTPSDMALGITTPLPANVRLPIVGSRAARNDVHPETQPTSTKPGGDGRETLSLEPRSKEADASAPHQVNKRHGVPIIRD